MVTRSPTNQAYYCHRDIIITANSVFHDLAPKRSGFPEWLQAAEIDSTEDPILLE